MLVPVAQDTVVKDRLITLLRRETCSTCLHKGPLEHAA
jgi:hypothetical protein